MNNRRMGEWRLNPMQSNNLPKWAFRSAPAFSDCVVIARKATDLQDPKTTLLYILSFGVPLPEPDGQNVATVALLTDTAKNLYERLGDELRKAGAIS